MKPSIKSFELVIILFLLFNSAQGQQKEPDIKMRLAQSYERSNNFEQAIALYEYLYAKDSSNMLVADALQRCYVQTGKFSYAVAIVKKQLTRAPNEISLLAQLGNLYLLASDEQNAYATWERAISTAPKSEISYRIVGGTMIQGRVFDKAIELYQRGRAACGNPLLFTNDIAYLYAITLKYADATREYIRLLKDNANQLGYVQSRIATYTNKEEARKTASLVVEDALKSDSNNLQLLQLLAWLSMEGKRYDEAFEIYKRIDEKNGSHGKELNTFAERALKEKAYTAASKAFLELITHYPGSEQIALAHFGYARALEELSIDTDSLKLFGKDGFMPQQENAVDEQHTRFSDAFNAYKKIVRDYPDTEIAARALFRIAVLMHERLFNLQEAFSALHAIENTYAKFPLIAQQAQLKLAEVYISMGELDKSEKVLTNLVSSRTIQKDLRETALLHIAELSYYRGQFQAASTQLQTLTKDASSDIVNDALNLSIFIKENLKPSEAALKEYSAAELLQREHKYNEALTALNAISINYTESNLIDETLMAIGDTYARMRKFSQAIDAFNRLLKDFPESISLDKAQLKIGQILEHGFNNKIEAIAAYNSLLEKFPHSIYTNEARRRIRELRGDTL